MIGLELFYNCAEWTLLFHQSEFAAALLIDKSGHWHSPYFSPLSYESMLESILLLHFERLSLFEFPAAVALVGLSKAKLLPMAQIYSYSFFARERLAKWHPMATMQLSQFAQLAL